MTERSDLLAKIKALLAKTIDAGCTEQEADAALSKARTMMEVYEISEADLELTKQEKAILAEVRIDRHKIGNLMAVAIAKFTSTACWGGRDDSIRFCGLPIDVDFATYLLASLTRFAERELVDYLAATPHDGREKRRLVNGFAIGFASRVSNRLRALSAPPPSPFSSKENSNSRALVAVQAAAIADYKREHGIVLGRGRSSSRVTDGGAIRAGAAAGERASFGRPVGGPAETLRLR